MKKLIICSLLILMGLGIKAQASFGFANTSTPGLSDTVLMSSIVTYGVNVQNTGNQPFSGNFTVFIAIQDTSSLFLDVFDSVNVQTPSLLAGDTSGVTITHDISPAKFMDGNNTVVIWPAAPGFQTTDSIIKDIFVLTFEKVDELAINQINIFPNPVSEYLIIKSDYDVEKVRILDLKGLAIITSNYSNISLSQLENGIYIVEVETSDGKYLRKKIIVSR